MQTWYLLFPLVGAFCGFLIHAAVLLVLIPVSQKRITGSLGKWASNELPGTLNIESKLRDPSQFEKIRPVVEMHVDEFLREKLPKQMPMISMFVGDKTITKMKSVFMEELEKIFPVVIGNFAGNLQKELDLEKLVTQKFGTDKKKWKEMVKKNLQRELRIFRALGALTGFIIGALLLAILAVL